LKGGKDSGGVKGRRVITGALNSGISKRKKERKRGGEGRGGGGIGKGEGIDNGEPGVTAILYLARRDRVNELRLRGGPIMGLFLSSGPPSLRELQSDLTK